VRRIPVLEVRELSKRYGDKLAVDRLSFAVEPGTVTGFLGRTARANPPRCA